jgi:hypothetical protein
MVFWSHLANAQLIDELIQLMQSKSNIWDSLPQIDVQCLCDDDWLQCRDAKTIQQVQICEAVDHQMNGPLGYYLGDSGYYLSDSDRDHDIDLERARWLLDMIMLLVTNDSLIDYSLMGLEHAGVILALAQPMGWRTILTWLQLRDAINTTGITTTTQENI